MCCVSVARTGRPPPTRTVQIALGDVFPMMFTYDGFPATYASHLPSGDHAGECSSDPLTTRRDAPPSIGLTSIPAESAQASCFPSGDRTAVGFDRRNTALDPASGRDAPPSAGTWYTMPSLA